MQHPRKQQGKQWYQRRVRGADHMQTQTHRGAIEVIFGPMFSGKSTELLRRIRRYLVAQRSCFVIKYHNDSRYDSESVSTHDRILWKAHPCGTLSDVEQEAVSYDVIGIDEGQFFPDIVQFAEKMANLGKIVIVAALDGTFQRKPFNTILELVPLAEHVTKLTAVCVCCSGDAAFTKRIGTETKIEVIGGADKYVAVCRFCYLSSPLPQPRSSPTKFIFTSEDKPRMDQVRREISFT
eukprot:TRINITY_DN1604_c0_g1_i3.p1 TRINITY_DN1604_c0_g1~~TRINITY_DN1604_c0_g1_i3.p1  ORF type:complete len:237 (+),score=42.86 TRINITY_DN1604_c0_g1_i3:92-802(+)